MQLKLKPKIPGSNSTLLGLSTTIGFAIIVLFLIMSVAFFGNRYLGIGSCLPLIEPSLQARNAEVYHASVSRVFNCLALRGDPRASRFRSAARDIVVYFAYEEGLLPDDFESKNYVNAEALAFLHGKSPSEIIAFAERIRERSYALGNNLEMKRREREANAKGWNVQLPLMPVPEVPQP